MNVFERYLSRNEIVIEPCFGNQPEMIVIIPVLNDRDVFRTLDSLYACPAMLGEVGVIVLINHSERADEVVKKANRLLASELRQYVSDPSRTGRRISVFVSEALDLPAKDAGVGLARKIAMDAASAYFYRVGKPDAPVVSLDADTDVEPDYTDEIIRYFRKHPVAGVSLAYEHRLEECEGIALEAMVKYELYLRYYRLALAYTGHPYAYSCIGSAFAVRAVDYVAQGGMNKRQAGEDFYFLQKLIATGRYAVLRTTKVHPSPRFSERTPFGTGKAVKSIAGNGGRYETYHLDAFTDLKKFFYGVPGLYRCGKKETGNYFSQQAPGLKDYLMANHFMEVVCEVNANCASEKQFVKRFFDQFNAFRVLKYLNEVHGEIYRKEEVEVQMKALAERIGWKIPGTSLGMLTFLRARDPLEPDSGL